MSHGDELDQFSNFNIKRSPIIFCMKSTIKKKNKTFFSSFLDLLILKMIWMGNDIHLSMFNV